jgi:hypothetical protein
MEKELKKAIQERDAERLHTFKWILQNRSKTVPFSITWFRLLSVPWTQCYGDETTKLLKEWNGLTSLSGMPAFEVKVLGEKCYYFRGLPNPGFPGN